MGINGLLGAGQEESDEDSLKSLMGNNYGDDDDSTVTEDELSATARKDVSGRRRDTTDAKHSLIPDARSLGRLLGQPLPGHCSLSTSSRHPSTRTGPGRPPRQRTSDRRSRAELVMAEKQEARAIEKLLAEKAEAKALERSLRAQRRSDKKRIPVTHFEGVSGESMLNKSLEVLVGKDHVVSRLLETVDGGGVRPRTSAEHGLRSGTELCSSDGGNSALDVKMVVDMKGRELHATKPMEEQSSSIAADSLWKPNSAEIKDRTRSSKTNRSGERIRLLSEKLKEKLQRSETDSGDQVSNVVSERSEDGNQRHGGDSGGGAELLVADGGDDVDGDKS